MRVTTTICAVAAALALASSTGAGSASSSTWRPIKWHHFAPVQAVGRVWLFNQEGEHGRFVTRSARISGARLGPWVEGSLPKLGQRLEVATLGDDLVFSDPAGCNGTTGCDFSAARMHPDGSLGTLRPLTGAPPRAVSSGSPVIQLPDRVVALTGEAGIRSVKHEVCCSVDGKSVDLNKYTGAGLVTEMLGVDTRGRLSFAWESARVSRRQQARILQLDASTLAPRGQPIVVAAQPFTQIVDFACTDTCRLVAAPYGAAAYSHAGDEPSPTRIRLPGSTPRVLAARAYGGRLAIAYEADVKSDVSLKVKVAVGDARGRNVRVVRAVLVPWRFRGGTIFSEYGRFGPQGFALVVPYQGARSVLARVAILPVG